MKRVFFISLALCVVFLTACSSGSKQKNQYQQVDRSAGSRVAYIPHNNVEFQNYNNAQKLYDSPSTIQWCTTTWGNPSAPMVTVPITGKLTSSTTTFFAPEHVDDMDNWGLLVPSRSVDGMYHPNPPSYRYGFTPGGQYVDFFGMPTFCTTAMTKFQRQKTAVTTEIDPQAAALTAQAEAALRAGDKTKAAAILRQLGSVQGG